MFDRVIEADVDRIALVDTFLPEPEESVRVAGALKERLWGVRLDTASERGGVTAELVVETRRRLDEAGHRHVKIVVSGGIDAGRIRYFIDAGTPFDAFGVGSSISAAPGCRLHHGHQGGGRPSGRQARPRAGITENPRLNRVSP